MVGLATCKSCPQGHYSVPQKATCYDAVTTPPRAAGGKWVLDAGAQAYHTKAIVGLYDGSLANPYGSVEASWDGVGWFSAGSLVDRVSQGRHEHVFAEPVVARYLRTDKEPTGGAVGLLLLSTGCPNFKSCSGCPAGRYQDKVAHTDCAVCATGRYQAAGKSASCIDCAAGRYQAWTEQISQASCLACAGAFVACVRVCVLSLSLSLASSRVLHTRHTRTGGRFQPAAGQASCHAMSKCGSGRGRKVGTGTVTTDLTCEDCHDQTEYNGQSDISACNDQPTCPAGEELTGRSATAKGVCKDCREGFFSGANDLTMCGPRQSACPNGAASEAGASGGKVCRCGPGSKTTGLTWDDVRGLYGGACVACGAGKYQGGKSAAACTNCAAGKFAASTRSASCAACGVGTFAAQGAAVCTQCGAGTYQQGYACAACSSGRYQVPYMF